MSDLKPAVNQTTGLMQQPAVLADSIGKDYILTGAAADGGYLRRRRSSSRTVDALRGVTFVAQKGESIGIIGRNGSGKSTLLRIIAGSESPTAGQIYVSDQPRLLGVSPALQGWLTGEQNAYLGLLALGMGPREAKDTVPKIIEWTELGEAATRPMSTYSSGMGSKLSFAISTAVRPEILLVDEALSTGDSAFGGKAQERMDTLLQDAGNIFLVSHSLSTVRDNCDRSIWIHQGDQIADGPSDVVTAEYERFCNLLKNKSSERAEEYLGEIRQCYLRPEIRTLRK